MARAARNHNGYRAHVQVGDRHGVHAAGLRHNCPMDADVVVIGAGALGLSTALHCALAGRSVVVVDRDTAGSQASGRTAGLFKSVQADELRTRLARRSIAKAITFEDWAGTPLPVARPGSFLIARTPGTASCCARNWRSPGAGVPTSARQPGPSSPASSATTGRRATISLYGARRTSTSMSRPASSGPAWRPASGTGRW
jgi:hypothetical protein